MMANDARTLTGVKGWLTVFMVTLMLSAIVSLIVPIQTKATTSPLITMQPGWSAYLGVVWLLALSRTGGCTYLAWLLYERQVASTPRVVITGLWLLALAPPALDLLAVTLLLDLDVAAIVQVTLPLLIRPVLYAAVWTAYLLRSRRVANTYRDDADSLVAVFE